MNNKRYVLTNDSDKNVSLWEIDTGKCVKSFREPFSQVQKLLTSNYDQIHSKKNPLPQSWMSVDIRLGVSRKTYQKALNLLIRVCNLVADCAPGR